MSLWSQIESDRDAVLLNDFDGLTCTAVQLATGRSFTGFYHESDSDRDQKFGIANKVSGCLWISSTATPKLQEQWQVILPDGKRIEVTINSFGMRAGAMQELKTEQVEISRYGASTFGAK